MARKLKQTAAQKRTASLIEYYRSPERADLAYNALFGLLTLGLALDADVNNAEYRARRKMVDTGMLLSRLDELRADMARGLL